MSIDAIRWAFSQQVRRPAAKLVLLSLADRVGESFECWPSKARLIHDTSLDRKTVQAALKYLESEGLIEDTGKRRGRTGQVRVWRLIGVPCRTDRSQAFEGSQKGTPSRVSKPEPFDSKGSQKRDSLRVPETDPLPGKGSQKRACEGSQKRTPEPVIEPREDISRPVPADFTPTEETITFAAMRSWPDASNQDTIDEFVLHYQAKPSLAENWQAMYLRWLQRKKVYDGASPVGRDRGGRASFDQIMKGLDCD